MKKEITLEDIARTLQEGLLKMDNGFNDVNIKLDSVDNRLTKVESRLDNIEANLNKKVDVIEYNTLEHRTEKLEEKFA
ncbi:MAG: hypothetical protein PHP62_02900 [Candidatus Moranbacteria bacterium]|nr:hypothetical protein [Candidatus Moranbacteria bacterium]